MSYLQQKIVVTEEFWSFGPRRQEQLKCYQAKFEQKHGPIDNWYITMEGDDADNKRHTIVLNGAGAGNRGRFIFTVPENELPARLLWLMVTNRHLSLLGEPKTGWQNDDFCRNHITAVITFEMKKPQIPDNHAVTP